MRNILYLSVFLAVFGVACSTSDESMYEGSSSIYFDLSGNEIDSIVYSFAKTTDTSHIIEIPLEIAGYAVDYDREFLVVVDKDLSTAEEGKHFEALNSSYILPKDEFTTVLPLTVYSTDKLLDSVVVDVVLRLVPNDDFPNNFSDRQLARIRVSNMLSKPSMWDVVYGRKYFGTWSKTKYKLILQICEIDDLPPYNGPNRYLLKGYGMKMQNYFRENYPVYDENNQIIDPNWTIIF